MKLREVKPGTSIFMVDDALSDDICDRLISLYEHHKKEAKQLMIGDHSTDLDIRNTTGLLLSQETQHIDDKAKELDGILYHSLWESAKLLVDDVAIEKSGVDFTSDSGYEILKYDTGGHYSWHIDHYSQSDFSRQLTAIWYLNDDMEGGCTEFRKQDVSIKPKKGSIVFFPSVWSHVHRSTQVTKGLKYAVVTWMGYFNQ